MRFLDAMRAVSLDLVARGHRATLPAPTPAGIDPATLSERERIDLKAAFVDEHLCAIRMADALLVVNLDAPEGRGYVGPSALVELAFAVATGTRAFLLHPVGEQASRPEVLALRPTVLHGDLSVLG